MFYVKTAPDGALEQYPYTLTDLRRQNKGTSWPKQISDEVAADFGVFPVTPAPQPADNYTVNLERTAIKQGSAWVEQWIENPATPEQIAERTAAKANDVRTDRNQRLADCDWTQLADSPLDPDGKVAWALYRETLRMVPQQAGFPWNVQWPPVPGSN
jgi:hypothetical protein